MNLYYFELSGLCPNGKLKDRYDCVLASTAIIVVEHIVDFAKRIGRRKVFQEEIADLLRNEFQAKVTVTGFHYGVKVVCERE